MLTMRTLNHVNAKPPELEDFRHPNFFLLCERERERDREREREGREGGRERDRLTVGASGLRGVALLQGLARLGEVACSRRFFSGGWFGSFAEGRRWEVVMGLPTEDTSSSETLL